MRYTRYHSLYKHVRSFHDDLYDTERPDNNDDDVMRLYPDRDMHEDTAENENGDDVDIPEIMERDADQDAVSNNEDDVSMKSKAMQIEERDYYGMVNFTSSLHRLQCNVSSLEKRYGPNLS
jgi:hypothetical protein